MLLLLYSNLYFLAAGAWYVNPVFEIPWIDVAYMWDELQFSPIGIIGVLVPLAALGYAYYLRSANPAKYEILGRFINQGA